MQALRTLKRTDVRIKLVLVVSFGLFYALAGPYPEKSKQFPQLIALFTLIVSIISLILDCSHKSAATARIAQVDDTELTGVDEQAGAERQRRFYLAWAVILASTAAGLLGGFLFTTFFLFVGFALIFGKRQDLAKNSVIALVMTACIYFAFQWLMGVPLLTGILWKGP